MKEKDLCVTLGLSRQQMKQMRADYSEGEDWVRIESNRPRHLWEIQWTEKGIEKLRDVVGVKKEETLAPPANYKAVVKARFPNIRFLQVDMQGATHTVLCRDNTKFKAGMPVWLRWDGNRWVVARHPRFNGIY